MALTTVQVIAMDMALSRLISLAVRLIDSMDENEEKEQSIEELKVIADAVDAQRQGAMKKIMDRSGS